MYKEMPICEDVQKALNELKTKINNTRRALHYIQLPNEEEYPTECQTYTDGYNAGLYNGIEMALGLLETVEDDWTTIETLEDPLESEMNLESV